MRLLQLTKKFPFPLKDGEAWAVKAISEGLKNAGASLDLFSLNTKKHFSEEWEIQHLQKKGIYHDIFVIDHVSANPYLRILQSIITNQPFQTVGHLSGIGLSDMSSKVDPSKYDALLVESVFMIPYAKRLKKENTKLKIVLRAHNVEHLIWSRYSGLFNGLNSYIYRSQSQKLKNFELDQLEVIDGLIAMSDVDLDYFKKLSASIDSNNSIKGVIGMHMDELAIFEREDKPFILGYIGSIDWKPNAEGLRWFLDTIWPRRQSINTEVVFMVAGSNSDKVKNMPLVQNVNYLGEVDDSDQFLKNIDCLIVPLRAGSGTRVKILQAFKNGTPVITSPLGMEGLDVKHKRELLISEGVEEWTDSIETIIDGPDFANQLASNASKYLKRYHDRNTIGREIYEFVEKL